MNKNTNITIESGGRLIIVAQETVKFEENTFIATEDGPEQFIVISHKDIKFGSENQKENYSGFFYAEQEAILNSKIDNETDVTGAITTWDKVTNGIGDDATVTYDAAGAAIANARLKELGYATADIFTQDVYQISDNDKPDFTRL